MRTFHALMNPASLRVGEAVRRAGVAAIVLMLAACGGSADAPPPPESAAPIAPTVTQQPADATVAPGATATFTAAATGTPAPTVQWEESTNSGDSWTTLAGATSASFTTPATTLADSGTQFRAVFTNPAGSATTGNAQLTVTATSSTGMSLLAGDIGGAGSINGTGATARFEKPDGLAVDSAGNVYVAEIDFNTIRKITPAGVVTTFAGLSRSSGSVDGTGSAARFSSPSSVTVDGADNVYVADFGNGTVRKITPAGVVTTLAGTAGGGGSANGVGAAAQFDGPLGVAADASGNVYVADQFNGTIRKITPAGVVTTLAGTASNGLVDADGTGPAARFAAPNSVAVDTAGNVYVGEGGHTVRKITPAGVVTTLAGLQGAFGTTDGIGAAASFNYPRGVAVDAAGNVYVADSTNCLIRKITPAGVVSTLAGTAAAFSSLDGTGAAATFNVPTGIAVDATGKVYVGEEIGSVVRLITPAGVVSTLAGAAALTGSVDDTGAAARFNFGGTFGGFASTAVDASGNVFVTDFHNSAVRKITPAGVVSTFADDLSGASGIAIDATGNVFVGSEQVIFKVTLGETVSPLAGGGSQGGVDGTGAAASFGDIAGIAIDAAGNLYVADSINATIRKVTPAGVVTTFAGTAGVNGNADGTGPAASFNDPNGVAVDVAGNVYVADSGNNTIRKITPAGVVSTVAGTAGVSGSADGIGPAASFNFPFKLTVDSTGNLYVAELGNDDVRKITPAGVVSTALGVAGEMGVRLGADGRLSTASGISMVGDHRLILVSADAVLSFDLP